MEHISSLHPRMTSLESLLSRYSACSDGSMATEHACVTCMGQLKAGSEHALLKAECRQQQSALHCEEFTKSLFKQHYSCWIMLKSFQLCTAVYRPPKGLLVAR